MKHKFLFFWNLLAFSMIQQMLAIWTLVPLSLQNPVFTSGISQFMYCYRLAWKIEYNLASMWSEHNCNTVWTLFGIALLWDWNETWLFQSCGMCWVFQICWHIECSILTASSFRIWWTGIPSPLLALFVVMLPKVHLTSHSRMFGSRWVITPLWLSKSLRSFGIVLLCIVATSS